MDPIKSVKPQKASFVFFPIFIGIIFTIIVIAGFTLIWTLTEFGALGIIPLLAPLVVIIAIILFYIADRFVRYNNYSMAFYSDRMIMKTKGIFTQKDVELLYDRVTHVTCVNPWIAYAIFGTGKVVIESAGTSGAEVVVPHIENAKELYDEIESQLQTAGFSLAKNNVLVQDKPNIPYTLISSLISTIGTAIFFMWYIIIEIASESDASIAETLSNPIATTILVGYAILVLIYTIFVYINRSHEEYIVYDDSIYYHNSVFSKVWSFLPAENLSDSVTSQGVIARVMGVFSVKLSVQGSGSEVTFTGLKKGKEIDAAVDTLVSNFKGGKQPKASKTKKTASKKAEKVIAEGPELVYKPHLVRNITGVVFVFLLIGLIGFISYLIVGNIFPQNIDSIIETYLFYLPYYFGGFLFFLILVIISSLINTYTFKSGRVLLYRKFITTHRMEFTSDKITEVVMKRNPFDLIFKTMSVDFKSIGSGANMELKAIPYSEESFLASLKADNIVQTPPKVEHQAVPKLLDFVMRNVLIVGGTALLIFITTGIIQFFVDFPVSVLGLFIFIALVLIPYFFDWLNFRNSKLRVHNDYLHFNSGWWTLKNHYAGFDSIKDFTSTKYFTRSSGTIVVNIAGDEMSDKNSKNSQQTFRSTYFAANYLPDVFSTHSELISLFGKLSDKELLVVKPQARNGVGPIVLFGLLSMVLIVPTLIYIPFYLWYIRVTSFHVFPDRVEKKWGILNKSITTINYNMFDHIKLNKNFLNTIFGNAYVDIHTTGSGMVELRIGPIEEYEKTQKLIEEHYKK